MAALNKAISERRFKQVRSLIDLGVNLNSKDREGKTALIQLCFVEPETLAVAIAVRLLKRGANIDATDNEGLSAFSTAVIRQKESMVALFLEETGNFDLNSRDKRGNTALFYAANVGNFHILSAIVAALKKFQLSVNVANIEGVTPLIQACMNGDVVCAKYLIKEGKACINSRDWIYRKTALEWAKMKGIQENVFLSNGESIRNGLSENKMCGKLVENDLQDRRRKCSGKKPQENDLDSKKRGRTYKVQLRQVYQIYEWQLTASFKLGKKPKPTVPGSAEGERNGKTNSDSPKGRNLLRGGKTAKLLKRNSALANNVSRSFPFQKFQRSQSFTDLTKLNYLKDSERQVYSPTFPRISSAHMNRSGKVRQESSEGETVSSSASISTVFEANEPGE